jgi:hypothetical protein
MDKTTLERTLDHLSKLGQWLSSNIMVDVLHSPDSDEMHSIDLCETLQKSMGRRRFTQDGEQFPFKVRIS